MRNAQDIKKDFPFFSHNPTLVYLDNAATSQKPLQVITALQQFYEIMNAPVRRGMYSLAEKVTALYEDARAVVAQYIEAKPHEVVFTFNATDSINMVAYAWARHVINEGDEVVVTILEHHANFLVWQQLCQEKKAVLRVMPLDYCTGDKNDFETFITHKTRLVAVLDVSHVLGITLPLKHIVQQARRVGAKVLIDGCQSVPHGIKHIKKYDPDFLVFSGHKMGGPTGIGVLYCAQRMHKDLQPYRVGGGMVYAVMHDHITWQKMPYMLEAGSPPVAQAIALAQAVHYINNTIDLSALTQRYHAQINYCVQELEKIPGITVFMSEKVKKQGAHLISFMHETIHPHDVALYLDNDGICVRAGNHCAQPFAQALGIVGSVRMSCYFYTTDADIQRFIESLRRLKPL